MSPAQVNRVALLRDRAAMVEKARSYLRGIGCIEVDVPLVTRGASVDAHIDLISVEGGRFLHSSPEYGMKRLLCEGVGDIFQISHVFRNEEQGPRHNPEFMMAEWYRLAIPWQQMIEETAAFVALFLGERPLELLSYREAFLRFGGNDPFLCSNDELFATLKNEGVTPYPSAIEEGRDALLNLVWGVMVEPCLGIGSITVISDYPAFQAALAQRRFDGEYEVAERFEIYVDAVELANGYHELGDWEDQRERLFAANRQRRDLGKGTLPVDMAFLDAIKGGTLPDCCGVAVGFDRLMMLRHRLEDIGEVIAFPWNRS